jgi:hypothetical protein
MNTGASSFQVYDFGKTDPFSRCTEEYAFENKIIKEQCSKKEPVEIKVLISPIHHVPIPALFQKIRERKNN